MRSLRGHQNSVLKTSSECGLFSIDTGALYADFCRYERGISVSEHSDLFWVGCQSQPALLDVEIMATPKEKADWIEPA